MTEAAILNYIESCINFHHDFDQSYKITEDAWNKENLHFLTALNFINQLRKKEREKK